MSALFAGDPDAGGIVRQSVKHMVERFKPRRG
jgi:hypothetical protein